MRGRFPHLCRAKADRVQQDIGIVQKCFIRQANNGETGLGQTMVAQRVLSLAQSVNPAVQFENQPEFRAKKVRHIARDGRLTTELPSLEAAIAKQRPKAGFSGGCVFAKTASASRSVRRLVHGRNLIPSPLGGEGGSRQRDG